VGVKRWHPVSETTVETARYRYVFGVYDHDEWGKGCFRVAKYLKENDYYIGHFVIVPEDAWALARPLIKAFAGFLRGTSRA
jgi:hypothetical protein